MCKRTIRLNVCTDETISFSFYCWRDTNWCLPWEKSIKYILEVEKWSYCWTRVVWQTLCMMHVLRFNIEFQSCNFTLKIITLTLELFLPLTSIFFEIYVTRNIFWSFWFEELSSCDNSLKHKHCWLFHDKDDADSNWLEFVWRMTYTNWNALESKINVLLD